MSDQQLVRPAPISGFPEWLPEVRRVELQWLDQIRQTFERYGFASIETPSVEALEVLVAKGETAQEVYTLRRLQAEPNDGSDARLGLHFDLTVPFALRRPALQRPGLPSSATKSSGYGAANAPRKAATASSPSATSTSSTSTRYRCTSTRSSRGSSTRS